jgi:small ligand-binding sensory domain FIST
MGPEERSGDAAMAWGFSGHHDASVACGHVLEQVTERLAGRGATFAFLFAGGYAPTAFEALAGRVAGALGTDAVVGMSAAGINGGRTTVEDRPGLSVLAGAFAGASARAFAAPGHAVPIDDGDALEEWADALVRPAGDHRGAVVFADPSTLAVSRLAPALYRAGKAQPILGALTGSPEAARKEREPALLCARGRAQRGGLVGLTLAGGVKMDTVLAQACRPVGPPMVVTRSHRNLIRELGGKPAIEAVQAVAHTFSPEERRLLAGGLYIGIAVDEYRERFGRGDFIVRRVLGGHGASGSIAIDEPIRPGRTVQVHLLDPGLARGDLGLLLDGQKLHGTPAGALILTDTARGRGMFDDEWSDATAVARAFDHARSGEEAAKGGYEIAGIGGSIPVAGCLAPGQIAPIGGSCRVHSTCAGLAVFRGAAAGESPGSG